MRHWTLDMVFKMHYYWAPIKTWKEKKKWSIFLDCVDKSTNVYFDFFRILVWNVSPWAFQQDFHWKPNTNINLDTKVKMCSLKIKHVIVKHLSKFVSQVQIIFYLSNEVDEKTFSHLYSVPFSISLQPLFINCWECNEP